MRFYNFLCDGLPHLLLDLFLQISYILMLLCHLVKNSFSVFADSRYFSERICGLYVSVVCYAEWDRKSYVKRNKRMEVKRIYLVPFHMHFFSFV